MQTTIDFEPEYLIQTGEWFDEEFGIFTSSEKEIFVLIRNHLLNDNHPISITGESYRIINHWDSKGLLFENKARENGWRKFSLSERVWIGIIRELRYLGISITSIKRLKDNLFLRKGTYTQIELAFFITKALTNGDVILLCDKDGRGNLCLIDDFLTYQLFGNLPTSYITLNLNALLDNMKGIESRMGWYSSFMPMSNKDLELQLKMMSGSVDEIKIKVKDGKMDRINYKSHIKEPEEAIKEVRDLLKDGKRKAITLYQDENGKIISIMKEEKT